MTTNATGPQDTMMDRKQDDNQEAKYKLFEKGKRMEGAVIEKVKTPKRKRKRSVELMQGRKVKEKDKGEFEYSGQQSQSTNWLEEETRDEEQRELQRIMQQGDNEGYTGIQSEGIRSEEHAKIKENEGRDELLTAKEKEKPLQEGKEDWMIDENIAKLLPEVKVQVASIDFEEQEDQNREEKTKEKEQPSEEYDSIKEVKITREQITQMKKEHVQIDKHGIQQQKDVSIGLCKLTARGDECIDRVVKRKRQLRALEDCEERHDKITMTRGLKFSGHEQKGMMKNGAEIWDRECNEEEKSEKDGNKFSQQESAQQQTSRNSMYQQRAELDCEMEYFWRYLMTISKCEWKAMQRRGWARENVQSS